MLEIILIILTLVVLLIASYTDLKKREVPDWLSYGFIFSALGIRTIFSLENFDFLILLKGVLGLIIFLILGFIFYYSRFWGGGDTKILMGLGAVLGFEFSLIGNNLIYFFLFLLFAGALYGLFYVSFLAIKNRKNFIPEWKKIRKRYSKEEKIFLFSFFIFFLVFLFLSFFYSFLFLIPPFLLPFLFYLLFFFKAVESSFFYYRLPVKKLTEGDWLAEEINILNVRIKPKPLTKKEINELINLNKRNQLETILVKGGIPFLPSFLIAFVVNLWVKDWLIGLLNLR